MSGYPLALVEPETGYDVVGELEEEIGAVMQAAAKKGVALPQKAAMAIAVRNVQMKAYAPPRAAVVREKRVTGRGSGMSTSCGLGQVNFPAASPAGTILNLQVRAEEPFVAHRLVLQAVPFAAAPPAACAGIMILVVNVQIGTRSVLSSIAGIPIDSFGPNGTGGQLLAGGVQIERATLITVQLQQGPIAIPAGEQINVSGALYGAE